MFRELWQSRGDLARILKPVFACDRSCAAVPAKSRSSPSTQSKAAAGTIDASSQTISVARRRTSARPSCARVEEAAPCNGISSGRPKSECAVVPPGSNAAAIPDIAQAKGHLTTAMHEADECLVQKGLAGAAWTINVKRPPAAGSGWGVERGTDGVKGLPLAGQAPGPWPQWHYGLKVLW